MHLKFIASIQLLRDGLDLTQVQIDRKFGYNIKHIKDFIYLDGTVFKNELINNFQNMPISISNGNELETAVSKQASILDEFTYL